MKFLPYPSLTNHFTVPTNHLFNTLVNIQFYASEKIDGANINISINLEHFKYLYGKRTNFLSGIDINPPHNPDYPDQYNLPFAELYNLISESTVKQIVKKINKLNVQYNDSPAKYAHIYGELFGDQISNQNYSNSGLDQPSDVKLYDAILTFDETNNILYQLSLSELQSIIPIQYQNKVLKIDSLKNLLKTEPNEQSQYGGSNEGYVFKKVASGFYTKNEIYPVVKYKTLKYAEVNYSEKALSNRLDIENTETLKRGLFAYITNQRLHNILSHGELKLVNTDIPNIIKVMKNDIEKEFKKENPQLKVSDEHFDSTLNKLKPEIAKVIKENMKKT